MTFHVYLSFFATLVCMGLALLIYLQEPRSFVHRIFAGGMLILGLMEGFDGMKMYSQTLSDFFFWEKLGLISEAFIPGIWFLFSLSFGRSNYRELLSKWKWLIFISFFLPLVLLLISHHSFLKGPLHLDGSKVSMIPLGGAGYLFYLTVLAIVIMILINLEATLRSSVGIKRWRIKFMILGIGGIFAAEVYTTSQKLLFSAMNINETILITYAVIVGSVLIAISIFRSRLLDVDIHVSGEFIYNSLTLIGVGVYLLMVGILANFIGQFPGSRVFPLTTFFVFLSVVVLILVLMSDRLQQEAKRFIYRNFYRSRYDYRKQWMEFTHGITSKINIKDLCSAVTKLVSDTFGTPSVSIWVVEEPRDQFILGGSTVFSEANTLDEKRFSKELNSLLAFMRTRQAAVDFHSFRDSKVESFRNDHSGFLREARIQYCISLFAGQQFLGVMTLFNRITKQPFSMEDFDLLKVIAEQTAGSLLNLRLSQNLIKSKELEAFQSLSAFFIHDLKNLASTLSLTIKNLPLHYENPEFREDALKVVSKSVDKMNGMCSRLTLLTKRVELRRIDTDLNKLVDQVINDLQGALKGGVKKRLSSLPPLLIDPDQMQKVLTNVVLNANEAITADRGEIQIATEWAEENKVCLTIRDNGCGISKEFLARSLFQPFQTTKSHGLGIGLYHSKMIVEAHQGNIEVESREGEGTTFRVILPVAYPK